MGTITDGEQRYAAWMHADTEACRALGNANAARTEKSRERWMRAAQRWLDRANDLRGSSEWRSRAAAL